MQIRSEEIIVWNGLISTFEALYPFMQKGDIFVIANNIQKEQYMKRHNPKTILYLLCERYTKQTYPELKLEHIQNSIYMLITLSGPSKVYFNFNTAEIIPREIRKYIVENSYICVGINSLNDFIINLSQWKQKS